jgi:hypothetical protein
MKKRTLTFTIVVVLILILLGWRMWRSSDYSSKPSAGSPGATQQGKPAFPAVVPTGTSTNSNPAAPSVAPTFVDKAQMMMAEIKASNRRPIDFYGKVVDQYGQSVADVKIRGNILFDHPDSTSSQDDYTTTDANGEFNFTGLHGSRFGVIPSKDGYVYNSRIPTNWSESYKPDPSNPMVFTMWKLQGAVQLIHTNKFFGITPDGSTWTIDLIKGTKIENSSATGDLRVAIERPADAVRGQKFDWSFTMDAVDGGVIETQDPYLYEAPESGYQLQYSFTMPLSDPHWQPELQNKTFYLKSRDGSVYGHFTIEVIPKYQNTAIFSVDSYVNPARSRNLEPDSSDAQ